MVRDDTPTEDAFEQSRITGDRELEPDRWDALHLARLANRRRRAGQRPVPLLSGIAPANRVAPRAQQIQAQPLRTGRRSGWARIPHPPPHTDHRVLVAG